jgi:biotin carboxyl carrier protein
MKYFVTIGDRTLNVELGPEGVTVDGEKEHVDFSEMDGTDVHSLLLGGRSHRILATREGPQGWSLHLSGRHLRAEVLDERTRAIQEMTGGSQESGGPRALVAPMPGLVVKVEVEPGDEVFPGQSLVTVEAMKMENELRSEHPGTVSRVAISPGDAVDKDQILVEFEGR